MSASSLFPTSAPGRDGARFFLSGLRLTVPCFGGQADLTDPPSGPGFPTRPQTSCNPIPGRTLRAASVARAPAHLLSRRGLTREKQDEGRIQPFPLPCMPAATRMAGVVLRVKRATPSPPGCRVLLVTCHGRRVGDDSAAPRIQRFLGGHPARRAALPQPVILAVPLACS